VFTISKFERLPLRVISTSYIWEHFRQCSVCHCGKRFGISIQRLCTELEKNIDASRANFVDKLLSRAVNSPSRSLAINFGANQIKCIFATKNNSIENIQGIIKSKEAQ
jgi:hypothetical protein